METTHLRTNDDRNWGDTPIRSTIGPWLLESPISIHRHSTVYACRPIQTPPDDGRTRDPSYVMKLPEQPTQMMLRSDTSLVNRSLLEREIKILQRISHPHIASLLDAGWYQDIPYLVTPFVGTESLGQVSRRRDLGLIDRIWLARQLTQAVVALHRTGWCHLDLQPDNVMIDDSLHLTLIDLAFAHPIGHRFDQRLESLGCPAYTAPEWCHAEVTIEKALDAFAVGKLLQVVLLDDSDLDIGGLQEDKGTSELTHPNHRSVVGMQARDLKDARFRSGIRSGVQRTHSRHVARQITDQLTNTIPEARANLEEVLDRLIKLEVELLHLPWNKRHERESHAHGERYRRRLEAS